MSRVTLVKPVYAIQCDQRGCTARYRVPPSAPPRVREWAHVERVLEDEARKAGWSLRPRKGKGSRSAPDLCPDHAGGLR